MDRTVSGGRGARSKRGGSGARAAAAPAAPAVSAVPAVPAQGGLALNARAWAIADRMEARAAELRVGVQRLANGARVIDAGVDAEGGLGAGLLLARACMAGLGRVTYTPLDVGGTVYPGVQVWTDHPAVSCMASQYAGWAVQAGDYFAMGSGPLRAHARVERELFAKLGYAERADRGVLVLEARTLPTAEVARWVGEKSGLRPAQLTFIAAPTASLACGVQVVARILETGLHKMDTLGFDVRRVVSGIGTAPVPPVARSDLRAIGRTNDCILYGGEARFTVRADDDELEALAAKLPASASGDYGTPFYDVFKRYDGDFYKIDPLLFSPAVVWLTSLASGRTFRAGTLNPEVLRASLLD
jgi:methenyltetrahydromethanopterin cyclohydrolase